MCPVFEVVKKRRLVMNENVLQVEVGRRLEGVRGEPRQAFIKAGEKRIGSFLLWGENPGNIKLNTAGKFWLHELINERGQSC